MRESCLWGSYDFGAPLWKRAAEREPDRIQFVNGTNGAQKVLIAAPLGQPFQGDLSTDALYCFTAKGELLWSHRFEEKIQFGRKDYGPRWYFGAMLTSPDMSDPSTWIAMTGNPWWPSILFHFDENGKFLNEFVNAGHIHALNRLRKSDGSFLLVGGVNNEYDSAMLAVLNENRLSGTPPQMPDSMFACDNCPAGMPVRYFLFPRSEINRIAGPAYNTTLIITVDGNGVHVLVTETTVEGYLGPDWDLYEFTQDLKPISVSMSDHYWDDHRRLSAEKKIGHAMEDCPERNRPRIVREWDPQKGWKEIRFAPAASH